MEERAEYLLNSPKRPGKIFVGGYIDSGAAQRLRLACDAEGITMIELLERMSERVKVDFAPLGCGCRHD
jgi:hypothetical protein